MASKLQTKVLKYLKSLSCCWVIKVISANERGCPDILCCYRGIFWAIEVKESGDRLSEIQIAQRQKIATAKGFYTVTIKNMDIVIETRKRIDLMLDNGRAMGIRC